METNKPNRVQPKEGTYITVPNQPLTIEQAVDWINELQRRENKAWLWILRNRWNIGLLAKHLSVIYGENTIDRFSEELDMAVTTVRECLQVVKRMGGDSELYEAFITTPHPRTGKPIRWRHIQKFIRSNLDASILGPEALARRVIAMMEENNRSIETLNNAARMLPPSSTIPDEANGVTAAYGAELVDFVQQGHRALDNNSGDGLPEQKEARMIIQAFCLHKLNQTPDEGQKVRAKNRIEALEGALKELGYTVTEVNKEL